MRRFTIFKFLWLITAGCMFSAPCLRSQDTGLNELAKFVQQSREIQTLTADISVSWTPKGVTKTSSGSIRLMKPNYAMIKLSGAYPLRILASDGTSRFEFDDSTNYTKSAIDPRGEKIDYPWFGLPFRFFFTQSVNPFGPSSDPSEKIISDSVENLHGEAMHAIVMSGTHPMNYTARLDFDSAGVLRKTEVDFGAGPTPSAVFTAELSNVKLNTPMAAQSFRFVPGPGSKLKTASVEDAMLSIGDHVPDFVLPSPGGPQISLATLRKESKVTLVNFWYLHCPPCLLEFPDLEKLYQQFHGVGLNMVAIDRDDPAKAVSDYAARTGLTFPVVLGGSEQRGSIFDKYKVSMFPGTYLIDSEGRILYRYAGANVDSLKKELEKLGFK